ncbi:3'-5' exonuclease [Nitratiruptor sp. SB155-2]|uniref:3'-5' exonuclease n=1 Tax=Nitratiruptor sp. (strain SB155-2) TaxID=387092 RepID=UPI0001586D02|nr:3'-5' exonuclease [Nitratiruptor sp. SB155-2]BAF69636.1 DNA polymerase III, epsilon subunit [Nitratiruptor sp. SB155-2]
MFWQKWFYRGEFKFLFEPYSGDEIVFIDCETTGLDPKNDEILSIACLPVKKDKILLSKALYLELKPQKDISAQSIKIHHLRACDLQGAMEPKEAIERVLYFIKNRPVAGYYVEFDVKMISKYTKKFFGFTLPNKQIEVSGLYYDYKQKAIPQGFIDLKFDTILKDLNLPKLKAHNALNDTIMSAMIYLKLIKRRQYG